MTRYRHDESPHGSVYLSVDSSEKSPLGWISLSAHDCRLKGVIDEDSHELYDCVNEGLLLNRRTAVVHGLAPIDESGEVENEATEVVKSPKHAPRKESQEENIFAVDENVASVQQKPHFVHTNEEGNDDKTGTGMNKLKALKAKNRSEQFSERSVTAWPKAQGILSLIHYGKRSLSKLADTYEDKDRTIYHQ